MSSINIINTEDLRVMKNSEGLVIQGCGGDLHEWIDGINELLTKDEILLMAAQIGNLKRLGADGFVIGCLTADGELDTAAMQPLLKAAEGTGLTLHRCIDVSKDPCKTYLDAMLLGIDTVLTSGAAASKKWR